MTTINAKVTLLAADGSGKEPDWSPMLRSLLELGWTGLREHLDRRAPDTAGLIVDCGGAIRCCWVNRPALGALARLWGKPFPSLDQAPPAGHLAVLVVGPTGESGAGWIPLASVQVERAQ